MARASPAHRRRSGLARLCLGAAGLGLAAALLAHTGASGAAFVSGTAADQAVRTSLRPLRAEPEKAPAPAPAPSTALVAVTEETKATTVSVLGGLVGLLVGGVWVGAATFAAASYFVRKEDDDVAKALKGVAGGALETLNFGANINEKYEVTGKVGQAVSGAVESAKANKDTKDAVEAVTSAADGVVGAVKSVDKDVGIADTLGTFATSASDLAYQAVDKAVDKASELNKEYKVTDQISKQFEDATGKK